MENHGGVGGGEAEKSLAAMSEVKTQLRLATPLAVGCLLQKIILTISLMFVGRLGELSLASAALATSFASVTGFSVLKGMASALDTLCGQAFGAEQHHQLGVHKQRAMLVLTLVSVPISVIWAYTGDILVVFFRQNPAIAAAAGSYIRCMIPALFTYGLLECHLRFLQTQNVVVPVMLSSGATAGAHVLVCWLLVFRLGVGANGAALGTAVSNLINLCVLALYVRVAPSFKASWAGFSREAFRGVPRFLKLAVPSALMLCMEWWAFEILVLLSGLLPNPKLETAVLSIGFNICSFAFMIPLGLGSAASVRVSNELGAGRPQAARLAARVVIVLGLSVGLSACLVMFLLRNVLGYVYTNEREVALYAARMMPVLAVSTVFDAVQCVLSGVVRACGRQKVGAFVNLGAYYLVGLPAASVFAFVCRLRGMGLWLGILCGLVVQTLLLLSMTLCTDWNNEALKAKGRVFSSSPPVELTVSGCAEQADERGCVNGKETPGTIGATKGSSLTQRDG